MWPGSIFVTHPDNVQQALPLRSGRLRIGSAPDNDLIMAGPDIAPHHATLTCDERGQLIVEVAAEEIAGQGGMRLTCNLPQLAKPRALAWIGDYVLSYWPEI